MTQRDAIPNESVESDISEVNRQQLATQKKIDADILAGFATNHEDLVSVVYAIEKLTEMFDINIHSILSNQMNQYQMIAQISQLLSDGINAEIVNVGSYIGDLHLDMETGNGLLQDIKDNTA